jgi:1-deoxy-D-xylulose-5-phosphate reductoisomerase
MRLPIQYAFTYPARLHLDGERLDLFALKQMNFEPADMERFPCLRLAYEAIATGGTSPCVLNAANEVVNLAFREGKIDYPSIAKIIEETMAAIPVIQNPTLEQLIEADKQARAYAERFTKKD